MNTELIKLSAACGRDIYDMLQSIPADENGLIVAARARWQTARVPCQI